MRCARSTVRTISLPVAITAVAVRYLAGTLRLRLTAVGVLAAAGCAADVEKKHSLLVGQATAFATA